jgi:outer membrane protein
MLERNVSAPRRRHLEVITMNRLVLALIVSVSLPGARVLAQAPAAPKLGYVDVKKVLADSKPGKQAKEQLEKVVKDRQGKIDSEKKALDGMKADYEKNNLDLSDRQKQAKQKEYQERNAAYQKLVAESRKETSEKDAELTLKVMDQMRKALTEVAKAGDYALVVEKTATSVLYSKDGLDLTDNVIARMNAQN